MAKFRTIPEVDKEYYAKVAELGDREFKMTDDFPRQIDALKLELRNLIREAEQINKENMRLKAIEERNKKSEGGVPGLMKEAEVVDASL